MGGGGEGGDAVDNRGRVGKDTVLPPPKHHSTYLDKTLLRQNYSIGLGIPEKAF